MGCFLQASGDDEASPDAALWIVRCWSNKRVVQLPVSLVLSASKASFGNLSDVRGKRHFLSRLRSLNCYQSSRSSKLSSAKHRTHWENLVINRLCNSQLPRIERRPSGLRGSVWIYHALKDSVIWHLSLLLDPMTRIRQQNFLS